MNADSEGYDLVWSIIMIVDDGDVVDVVEVDVDVVDDAWE